MEVGGVEGGVGDVAVRRARPSDWWRYHVGRRHPPAVRTRPVRPDLVDGDDVTRWRHRDVELVAGRRRSPVCRGRTWNKFRKLSQTVANCREWTQIAANCREFSRMDADCHKLSQIFVTVALPMFYFLDEKTSYFLTKKTFYTLNSTRRLMTILAEVITA